MKAKVEYHSGWMLIIEKETNAPLLFLEYLSNFPAPTNILHKVIDNQFGVLKIRLNGTKEDYLKIAEYINNN